MTCKTSIRFLLFLVILSLVFITCSDPPANNWVAIKNVPSSLSVDQIRVENIFQIFF